jgi:glycine cleavage system pyridoxal-binding protein P
MFMTKEIYDQQAGLMNDEKISSSLKNSDTYRYRHIGNSEIATKRALDFLEVSSIDELMDQVVPDTIRLKESDMFKHNGRELHGVDSETLMLERMR